MKPTAKHQIDVKPLKKELFIALAGYLLQKQIQLDLVLLGHAGFQSKTFS